MNSLFFGTLTTSRATTPSPGGGGSPAWIDNIDFSTTDSQSGGDAGTLLWTAITLTAGTASRLRCKIVGYNYTGNIRLGLYNNAGVRLQTVVINITGNGTFEGTITDQSVSAGNYFVSLACEDNSAQGFADLRSVGQVNYNGSTPYGSGAPANLPSNDGPVTRTVAVGVYVTP